MAVDFSSDPTARGFFAPNRFEADVFDCEVSGKIPTDIDGAFYRVGGEWMYPPMFKDDSVFNTDGHVAMFRIKDGNCDFKNRFVRTPRYQAERKARKQLFGYYRQPAADDPSVRHIKDRTVANTNMLAHGGKLFALKEDTLPYEMDPNTLETKGPYDFKGKYKSPTFTAHPKMDERTGELITWGYEATGPASNDIFFYWIDARGNVKREVRFKAPYVSMIHDIALSPKHIIIPIYGMVTSKERLAEGKIHWGWDTRLPTYYGVLPRDGEAKDVRWFKGPERAIVHTFNAVDHPDGRLVMEAAISDSNPFPFFPDVEGKPFDGPKARTTARRITFDLNSKDDGFKEELLFQEAPGALCRIDDRYIGQDYRYGFMSYSDAGRPFDEKRGGNLRGRVSNCIGQFDFKANKLKSYFVGDTHSLNECCFVPRNASNGEEGDGYLVAVVSDYGDMRSEFVIVDAKSMEEAARVKLPFRVSMQVHGIWASSKQLPLVEPV